MAIADINVNALEIFSKELCRAHGEGNVLAVPTDVSKLEDVVRLRDRVYEAWGEVRVVRRGSRPSRACPMKGRGRDSPHRGAFPMPTPLFCF